MVSIIIPTYKEPDYLDLCLNSIFNVDLNPDLKFEVIVVVDGFPEINDAVIAKYQIHQELKVLRLPANYGLAVATNLGVQQASGETILLVNDDNVFQDNWQDVLEAVLQYDILSNRIICFQQIEPGVNVPVHPRYKQMNFGSSASEFDKDAFDAYVKSEVRRAPETSEDVDMHLPFLIKKKYYMAAGGWDAGYGSPHVIDIDFFLKLQLSGIQAIECNWLQFYHFSGKATKNIDDMNSSIQTATDFTRSENFAWQLFRSKWGYVPQNSANPIKGCPLLEK